MTEATMKKVYEDHLYGSINKIHGLYMYIFMAVLILVSVILLTDLLVKLPIVFNHVVVPYPGAHSLGIRAASHQVLPGLHDIVTEILCKSFQTLSRHIGCDDSWVLCGR